MTPAAADYSSWDRALLDREYTPSSRISVPLDRYIKEYARLSSSAREALPGYMTEFYGKGAEETLDLFLPPRRPAPLLIFFHGGYWSMLSKDDFSYLAAPFVASGIAFASVNYSLMPEVRIETIVEQARRAVAWLAAARPHELGIDPERVFIAGHSSGAHLAAMCLAGTGGAADREHGTWRLRGGCLISGIFDLEPLRHTSENELYRLDPETVRLYSPIAHPLAFSGLRVIGCYGEIETTEFKLQTARYLAACLPSCRECTLLELYGKNHFDVVSTLASPESALFAAVRQMIECTQR